MTKYAIPFAASLFAITAVADDVYHGLAEGNADLFDEHRASISPLGVQPGVGDRFDIYGGLGIGNQDLLNPVEASTDSGPRPNIYQGFGANPDLHY